jgi:GMP synthase (glutamine-hydrolysing)
MKEMCSILSAKYAILFLVVPSEKYRFRMVGGYCMKQDLILIVDLGSEENSMLARMIREFGVYSEICAHDVTKAELEAKTGLKGIILNGGKNRIVDGEEVEVGGHVERFGVPVIRFDAEPGVDRTAPTPSAVRAFVFEKCGAAANWNMKNFVEDQVALVRRQVGDRKVLLALSGGVDSSVVAALLIKAVGKQLHCVHVNHGLMRKGESEQVVQVFREELGANLTYVDASERFLGKLEGVADPEQKRKIIGTEFIRVFEEEARKLDGIDFLAQGTIYPDIVESGTKTAKSIKAHHNVGGLPDDMKFELVEPLKYLFKDEVRACGIELGLPESMVYRQPFPGPGLGVRCLGAITRDRLESLREADAILREEFALAGLDRKVWQYFTVVPEFRSVGIRDGKRSYEFPVILRAVNTVDAMTAEIELVDWGILQRITGRILREVDGVNRVLYDMTPKPPATIEWE